MAKNKEINSSVGEVGELQKRSFDRMYKTFEKPINTQEEVIKAHNEILKHYKYNPRRLVMRSLMSHEALKTAIKNKFPIEAIIPMDLVTGNPDEPSAIVYIAKNNHPSPPQGHDNIIDLIKKRDNREKPIDKVESMKNHKEFYLTKILTTNDTDNLFRLWKKFGWTIEEIYNFIARIQQADKKIWFSGIKNQKTGELISACCAETIEFAGIRYVETTEYSTLKDYEGKGLNTIAVIGLIAQILKDIYYGQSDDLIPVIAAEFNTSSNSVSVGASAGFVVANENEKNFGTLRYNVAVDDGQPPNKVFQNSDQNDRGLSFSLLRNFVLAVLPIKNIDYLYNEDVVKKIISYYQ